MEFLVVVAVKELALLACSKPLLESNPHPIGVERGSVKASRCSVQTQGRWTLVHHKATN